jgi:hypothetical protein
LTACKVAIIRAHTRGRTRFFLAGKKSEKLKKSIDSDTDLIFSLFIAGALPA